MNLFELVLLLIIAVIVVVSLWERNHLKAMVLNGQKTRLRIYYETIIWLWGPVICCLVVILISPLSFVDIGIYWRTLMSQLIGLLLVIGVGILFYLSIKQLKSNPQALVQVREQISDIEWMLPHDQNEKRWFVLGVSVSAGICEEILFRGFLLTYLEGKFGLIIGLVVSSAVFGMCHAYQGVASAIKTAAVGVVFGLTYWLSDNLLNAILLHIIFDIYAGTSSYIAIRHDKQLDLPKKQTVV